MLDAIEAIDWALFRWSREWHAPWLDNAMAWISAAGGAGAVWLALAAFAFTRPRDRAAAWRVALTIALSYALVDGVLKPVIARPRPVIQEASGDIANPPRATDPKRDLPPVPHTYAFPSGHATSTVGAAVAVSRMWPRTAPLWWALAALIAYSRVYLGHHFPLDVAGGALLGIAIAYWVLGGRHPATDARTLPRASAGDVTVRP
jgi:undecaprenyl-diphosphatase